MAILAFGAQHAGASHNAFRLALGSPTKRLDRPFVLKLAGFRRLHPDRDGVDPTLAKGSTTPCASSVRIAGQNDYRILVAAL